MNENEEPPPYVYDPSDAGKVAKLLDELALMEAVQYTADVAGALEPTLEARGISLDGALVRELVILLNFDLRETNSVSFSVHLAPLTDKDGWAWPRPLNMTPKAARHLWRDLYSAVAQPLLKAQFSDALLSSKELPQAQQAQVVVDDYLTVATDLRTEEFHRVLAYLRALSVARMYRLGTAEAKTRQMAFRRAKAALSSSEPGWSSIRLLRAVAVAPKIGAATNPSALEVLQQLEQAHLLYASDLIWVDAIAEISRELATNQQTHEEVNARQIQAHLDMGNATTGPVKMHHLNHAAQLADRFHQLALRDEAVLAMQKVTYDEMGWKVTETAISIPKAAAASHLRRYRKTDGWGHALTIWLANQAPTGDHDRNLREAKKLAKNGGFLTVVSNVAHGPHNMPTKTTGPDELETRLLHQLEALANVISSEMLAEELSLIRARFGRPSTEDVHAFLLESFECDPALAWRLSFALSLWWEERFTEATHYIMNAVEAAARGLLLALDEPMYRVEMGRSSGQFPALDYYLNALERRGLDPDWIRSIRSALLSDGDNLRNLTDHGFRMNFSAAQAALVIRLASMLIVLTPLNATSTDASELAKLVPQPLLVPRRKLRRRLCLVWI